MNKFFNSLETELVNEIYLNSKIEIKILDDKSSEELIYFFNIYLSNFNKFYNNEPDLKKRTLFLMFHIIILIIKEERNLIKIQEFLNYLIEIYRYFEKITKEFRPITLFNKFCNLVLSELDPNEDHKLIIDNSKELIKIMYNLGDLNLQVDLIILILGSICINSKNFGELNNNFNIFGDLEIFRELGNIFSDKGLELLKNYVNFDRICLILLRNYSLDQITKSVPQLIEYINSIEKFGFLIDPKDLRMNLLNRLQPLIEYYDLINTHRYYEEVEKLKVKFIDYLDILKSQYKYDSEIIEEIVNLTKNIRKFDIQFKSKFDIDLFDFKIHDIDIFLDSIKNMIKDDDDLFQNISGINKIFDCINQKGLKTKLLEKFSEENLKGKGKIELLKMYLKDQLEDKDKKIEDSIKIFKEFWNIRSKCGKSHRMSTTTYDLIQDFIEERVEINDFNDITRLKDIWKKIIIKMSKIFLNLSNSI